jgi:aminodeoxychorismate lyase
MIVFLNGQFVPEAQAVVSVFDRSFLYGDGLFETIRVWRGTPFRWQQHWERLQRGAAFLKLRVPFPPAALSDFASRLIRQNQMPESLLRISLSRGVGKRGYSTHGPDQPVLAMTLHPAPLFDPQKPLQWRLMISSIRVPAQDRLANFKTCNKLPQILARAEAEAAGADEALLLNTDGEVAEAASSNLFWIERGTVCTTPLASGILAGVTRAAVLEICQQAGLPSQEVAIPVERLRQAQGVFLSLSSLGLVEVTDLDDHGLSRSPLVGNLHTAYQGLLIRECAAC